MSVKKPITMKKNIKAVILKIVMQYKYWNVITSHFIPI